MSTMFGFKKYISAIAILTDFKKTVDIILCQQSEKREDGNPLSFLYAGHGIYLGGESLLWGDIATVNH